MKRLTERTIFKIRKLRSKNLTQKQVAKKLKLSVSTVCKYEKPENVKRNRKIEIRKYYKELENQEIIEKKRITARNWQRNKRENERKMNVLQALENCFNEMTETECSFEAREKIKSCIKSATVIETDRIDRLKSDLNEAIEMAFNRGATDWCQMIHPRHYERLTK